MRGSPLRTDRGRLRLPWRLLLFGVLFLLVDTAVTLAFLLAGLEVLDPEGATGADLALILARFVASGVAISALTLAAARHLDRRTVADLGVAFDARWWRDLAAGGALGVGLIGGAYIAGLVLGVYEATVAPTAPPGLPLAVWLALVVLTMVAVGVYEELVVRGYLLTNLAEGLAAVVPERWAVVAALLASSLGFGLLHGINPGATTLSLGTITLAGVLLGLGYVCTGRLALPTGVHVTWNLSHVLLGLPVSGLAVDVSLVQTERSGPVAVHGGAFGPEGGLLGLAATAIGCLAVVGYARLAGRGVQRRIAVPEFVAGEGDPDERNK